MSRSLRTVDLASVRPAPCPAVETVFLAPEAVLFDDRHGEIHHLNPSASAVWLLLDGEQSIVDVATDLSEMFGVPEADMLTDVETIVVDFRRRGLLAGADRVEPEPETELEPEPEAPAVDDVSQRIETLTPPPNP